MTDNLGTLLRQSCQTFGSSRAIESDGTILRYRDLAISAEPITNRLKGYAQVENEPILVLVENSARDLISFMGVWGAGGVVVPVAAHSPPLVLDTIRAITSARLLVDSEDVREIADAPPKPRLLLSDAALIIFTSGSTGRPKGVVLSHKAFAGKLRAIDSMLNFTPMTRALLVLQMTFVFGTWVSLLTLMKGGSLFMYPRFKAESVFSALAEQGISDAAFVPTMLRKILASDTEASEPLRNWIVLRRILTGGEPFDRELGRQVRELLPDVSIIDIYGLTETCSSDFFCTTGPRDEFTGRIGFSSPGVRFRIADEYGNEVPHHEVGELQIQSPFVMSGYLDDPELTLAAFADGFFRSGDLARKGEDGSVELVGRSKELIVRGGTKIAPLELDKLLACHPAIAAALTVGVPDPVLGERIHVLLVPRTRAKIVETEVRKWVADRVESFKRPDVYHIGTELPVGRTGKVDRNALRRLICEGAAE